MRLSLIKNIGTIRIRMNRLKLSTDEPKLYVRKSAGGQRVRKRRLTTQTIQPNTDEIKYEKFELIYYNIQILYQILQQ